MADQAEKKVQELVVRCPKNMKLHKKFKRVAAFMDGSKADKNLYMRLMGVAIHEAETKVREQQRNSRNRKDGNE